MGCCAAHERSMGLSKYNMKMKDYIDRNHIKNVHKLAKILKDKGTLNDRVAIIKGIFVNALGYALYLGKTEIFIALHKFHKADVLIMENLFESQHTSGMEIICKHGTIDLLEYYLPIYLKNYQAKPAQKAIESLTVDFEKPQLIEFNDGSTYTPLHIACEKGHISIVSYIYNYFKDLKNYPVELDIEYQDEKTGENCALIACRIGHYAMIKFLHETCDANFKALNKKNEGAIQICAAASKKMPLKAYYECITYLVEQVGLDISYKYEETLLLTDSRPISKYIENQLKKVGINVTKEELERACSLERHIRAEDYENHECAELDLKNLLENNDSTLKSMPSDIESSSGSKSPFNGSFAKI
ncbi:unnamed protein product [Blepharisma stoltei]|uniref:Ankyrin repeat domain-containing protein n=1 Tax=Blepharisma stoltei TaxID=1481888 RepID=A0AAU9JL53_9CILI|nr:unnamed protein product [Blepharisma stoltei]